MADEPRFPAPEEAKRKDAGVTVTPSEPRAPTVVTRAEPAPDAALGEARPDARPKLSPEEVRAFLEVSGANRPGARAVWRRGRVVVVPIGIIGTVFHFVFGAYAPFAIGALVVAGVAWAARPLLRRDGWS